MGSRGVKFRIPGYKKAIIARDKLKNYLLNPHNSNGKSEFFRALGYNMKNWKRLESDLRSGIANNKAIVKIKNRYGHEVEAYTVLMPLGINKKAIVITGWEKDPVANAPRFITAYPEKKGIRK